MALTAIVLTLLFFVFKSGVADDSCEEIMVPMCRGLIGYTHTKLPNRFGHKHQRQVYR